jgi:hypothetical protein
MRIEQTAWRGEVPRVTPRALPTNAAQDATNARLQSGDLETWRQYVATHTLATAAPVETIYLLKDVWLSWGGDVAVARGPVPGDTTFRTILAGPTVYSQPQLTTYAMATSGPEPYPFATRPLGVPAPVTHDSGADIQVSFTSIFAIVASGDELTTVTSYVYTYVNDIAQESAPSLPDSQYHHSTIFQSPIYAPTIGGSYNELILPAVPAGDAPYGVATARIYRAATGSTGTAFRFVAEVAVSSGGTTTYNDTLLDSQLGEVLITSLWDLPPTDLQGVLALPNGVMAGFSGNILCFSAQNYPHAWPVSYQLTTDTNIVGIGNIDTTVVVFTQSFTYLAIGTDPAAYSMTKLETAHAGVSRRSIVPVLHVGVVGATPDGLLAVTGNGQVQNLTESIFTRRQWESFNPSSITAVEHDNIYFFAYDTGAIKGAFALDGSQTGFGLIPLNVHFSASYANPIEDRLYFVPDQITPITDALLPIADTSPTVNGHTIYEFDPVTATSGMTYRYRGKLNLMPRPVGFGFAQVKATDYTNLVLRLYGDGILFYERVVTDKEPFTLPLVDEYEAFEFEFVGTSVVRTVRFGETVDELNESNP